MFMKRFPLPRRIAPVAFAILLVSFQAYAQKPAATVANAPLTLSLASDATSVSVCSDSGTPQVRLTATAVSPDGNPIKYRWTTTAGVITGDGPVVTWNLAGLKPGYHKASLDIETAVPEGSCQAFASLTVLVTPCPPVRPVCPNVEVTCPTNIGIDQPLTFTSRATGGTPAGVTPLYNWSVSAGTIMEGQGTDTIKVDTTGLAGQTVRASLSIGGYNLECAADCAVSIPVPRLVSRRFDEFPDISRNNEKARLDNFAIELQNDPTATAYVIVYPGRSNRKSEVQHRASRIIEYLVYSRGLDGHRIVTLVGPARNELSVELWVTPQGAPPPNP